MTTPIYPAANKSIGSRMWINVVKDHEDAELPEAGVPGDAGLDVRAYIKGKEGKARRILIGPGSTRLIPTGIRVQPSLTGFAILVLSRSGLAAQYGVFVANSPGLIDPGYTGELQIILYNSGRETFYVSDRMRVAQLMPVPLVLDLQTPVRQVAKLRESERGDSGFGSTGEE